MEESWQRFAHATLELMTGRLARVLVAAASLGYLALPMVLAPGAEWMSSRHQRAGFHGSGPKRMLTESR